MLKKLLILTGAIIVLSGTVIASEKIAVVDLQKVVDNSSQVRALKKTHDAKMVELNKIVLDAQAEIEKETDLQKMMAAEERYRTIFNDKKTQIEKEYATKLAEIERSIEVKIRENALAKGYDYILAKSIVLHGGEDITEDIIKIVK